MIQFLPTMLFVSILALSITSAHLQQEAVNPTNSGIPGPAGEVISIGLKYIGTPYLWGGNSLSRGTDCSHFVNQCFRQAGYACPEAPVINMENYGMIVAANPKAKFARRNGKAFSLKGIPTSLDDLKPGDLLVCQLKNSEADKSRKLQIWIGKSFTYTLKGKSHTVQNATIQSGDNGVEVTSINKSWTFATRLPFTPMKSKSSTGKSGK